MAWTYPDARYYEDWYEMPASTTARPPDGAIKATVVDRLRENPHTQEAELRVDVNRGVVILQGIVGSRLAKRSAGDDCWDTRGVTDVSNQLEVDEEPDPEVGPQPVEEVMTRAVAALEAGAPLRSAAEVMRAQDIGSVVVTDGGLVAGIVTDRDLVLRAVAAGRDMAATTLGAICTDTVVTLAPGDPVEAATRLMREHAVRRVVVVGDDDVPVGVISMGDLARRRDPGSVLADVAGAPTAS